MNLLRSMLVALSAAVVLAVAPVAVAGVDAQPRGWEDSEPPAEMTVPRADEIAVATVGSYVYILAPSRVKVSIITVLGQPITDVALQAGCHRFRISARGIYILRAGSATFRITI